MITYSPKAKDIKRDWYFFDAEGKTLGRLASQIANILMGKHKRIFVYNLDCGDHVVVINAEKIVLTGNKMEDKLYQHYSGYPGGLKELSAKAIMREKPEKLVLAAVSGMLPKNKLRHSRLARLEVYAGSKHSQEAKKFINLAQDGKKSN